MFGLGIEYLNGWAMAAVDGAKKERAEWPPHPDRVFMAMAAAWFETVQDEMEKSALEWLERLPPPNISATGAEYRRDIKGRVPVTSYVPVNDSTLAKKIPSTQELRKLKDAGLSLVPEHRPRQPRKFPIAIPRDPVVHLIWNEEIPEEFESPLSELCRKVVYIGHSASFVQMWTTKDPPSPNLVPLDGMAIHRLRIFGPGKLDYLQARCNKEDAIRFRDASDAIKTLSEARKELDGERKAEIKGLKGDARKKKEIPFVERLNTIDRSILENQSVVDAFEGRSPNSLRPEPGLWQGYGKPPKKEEPEVPKSVFDPNLIVMNLSGKRLGLHSTIKLTRAVRGALLSAIAEPVPEWMSGHLPDGSPSQSPHLAIIPLPFVEHEHADGRIMGVALCLPRQLDKSEAGKLLEPRLRDQYGIPLPIKLFDGKWLECAMELETRESPPWSLRADAWTRKSLLWASVTPIVMDRHFDGKNRWLDAAESLKDSCERIGLPRPEEVLLHPVSPLRGAPHSREFPTLARKNGKGKMQHCHAVVRFSERVSGPVMIGAGRYRGYGLLRPVKEIEIDNQEGTDP